MVNIKNLDDVIAVELSLDVEPYWTGPYGAHEAKFPNL